MKVGLDLRFLGENTYSQFIKELIETVLLENHENHPKNIGKIDFTLYVNHDFNTALIPKDILLDISIKKTSIPCSSIREQTEFLKVLKKEKNDLMIFFDHYKPVLYTGEYYTILSGLKKIYYQNFPNHFLKYKHLFLLNQSLKKASKVICFDENTKEELIERFNVHEHKINMLSAFFMNPIDSYIEDNVVDIKQKYNIRNDFFIYSGGNGIEKNIERLIYIFTRIHKEKDLTGPNHIGGDIDLVILGDNVCKNLDIRNMVIDNDIGKHIHFVSDISISEKSSIYEHALGILFPSLYEPFPFLLSEPLYAGKAIISSDLKNIKEILGEKGIYVSAISTNSIFNTIKDFVKQKTSPKVDYSKVLEKYSAKKSARQLLEIIS